MNLEMRHYFDAAHQLQDSPQLVTKACARLHGHTYAVKVNILNAPLNSAGMVVDFTAIKDLIDVLDHRFINDILEEEPTAENIALYIKKQIYTQLQLKAVVAVCEGYKGESRASWVTA